MMNKYVNSLSIQALLIFIGSAFLYIITMLPDLGFTDSGELAAICSTLGIAHPTGYPLYTILGFITTKILPFSPVYSLNLFAALCTAASAGIMFIIIREILEKLYGKLSIHLLISAGTSLTFATAATVWSQASGLEVYSLQLVLINLSLLIFLKAVWLNQSKNLWILWGFLIGLSFTNHGTTILLAPAMIFGYFYDWKDNKFHMNKQKWIQLSSIIIPFLIGLSLWLYLPIRSSQDPLFNWGEVHRNWDKFIYHAMGKQYQVWMFKEGTMAINFPILWKLLPANFAWIGLIPVVLGIYSIWKKSKGLFLFLTLLIIGNLFYSLQYQIHDIDTYFLTCFIALFVFFAIGLYVLLNNRQQFVWLVMIFPIINVGLNWTNNNHQDDRTVPAYTILMTSSMEKNAVIISSQWDYFCSAFWYKQSVEHYRPDIILIEQELLRRTWYPHFLVKMYPELYKSKQQIEIYNQELEKFEQDLEYSGAELQSRYEQLINSWIDQSIESGRPVYITAEVLQQEPKVAALYEKIPQGLAFKLVKPKADGMPVLPLSSHKMDIKPFAASIKNRKGHLYDGIKQMAANQILNMAQYAWMTNRMKEATEFLQKAERIDPKNRILLQLKQAIENNPKGIVQKP